MDSRMIESVAETPAPPSPPPVAAKGLRRIPHAAKTLWSKRPTMHGSLVASKKSGVLALQGVLGLGYLLTLPLIAQPLVALFCLAAVGLGLSGLRYGLARGWRYLEKFCDSHLPVNPFKRVRVQAQNIWAKVISSRPVKSLRNGLDTLKDSLSRTAFIQKLARSRLVKKILNNRHVRSFMRNGTSEKQQELLLAGLTVQGSLTTIGLTAYSILHGAAALPFLATGGGLIAAGAAAYVIGRNTMFLYRGARRFKETLSSKTERVRHRTRRRPARTPVMTEEAAAQLEATTPAFNKAAPGKTPAKEEPECLEEAPSRSGMKRSLRR